MKTCKKGEEKKKTSVIFEHIELSSTSERKSEKEEGRKKESKLERTSIA